MFRFGLILLLGTGILGQRNRPGRNRPGRKQNAKKSQNTNSRQVNAGRPGRTVTVNGRTLTLVAEVRFNMNPGGIK